MTVKNGDMPAMPIFPDTGAGHAAAHHGLTKREQFAMSALQGILSNPYWNEYGEYTPKAVASASTQYADALLAELEKPNDHTMALQSGGEIRHTQPRQR